MSNLTAGTIPRPYGQGGRKVNLPVKATAQLWQGAMVAQINGACCTGTTAGSGPCIGVAEFDMLGGATDGATRVTLMTDQIFVFTAGTLAPTDATPYGAPLFMETDNTVGTGNGAEGNQIAGRFMGIEDDGRVRVLVTNQASWFDTAANLDDGGSSRFKCRAVVTSLAAYAGTTTGTLTASSNGAIGAQDGVTLVAGDLVFIEEGTTNLSAASDAGPYVVVSPGGAGKYVLTRPSWWQTGATITPGQVIEIGGEGTLKGGTSWKTFVVSGKVVDTDAPLFWVSEVVQAITLVAGNNGTAVVANVGIRSATKTHVTTDVLSVSGTNTGITNFAGLVLTPGAIGTGTFTLTAIGTALASIAVASTSVVRVKVSNW